jgi:hypothetical protein
MELSPEFKKMIEEGKALDAPKKRTILRIAGGTAHISDAVRADMQRKARMIYTPEGVSIVQDALVGKRVKHVFIEATFPELKGGQSRQSAHGEASGTKPAIARAFKNLLKTIPKKRISVISAKISITTKIVEG